MIEKYDLDVGPSPKRLTHTTDNIKVQLILILTGKGYVPKKFFKIHPNKRATCLVTKGDNLALIGKGYTNGYILDQEKKHFGIEILESPKMSDLKNGEAIKPQIFDRFGDNNLVVSIYEFIRGNSLEELILDRRISIENVLSLITELFVIFSQVNTNYDTYGPFNKNGNRFSSWNHFINEYFFEKIKQCQSMQIINDEIMQKLTKYLYSEIWRNKKNIVHYDLSTSNIILTQQNTLRIIDWDGYYVGDFLYSIAKILYYLNTNGFSSLFKSIIKKLKMDVDTKLLMKYLLFVIIEKLPTSFNYEERYHRDLELFYKLIKIIK